MPGLWETTKIIYLSHPVLAKWRLKTGSTWGKQDKISLYPISPEREELSTKFQRLSPHFWPRPIQRTYSQYRPTSGNENGGRQTGSTCIFGTGRDINEILTATPIFSTTPYSMESLPTLPDVSRLPEINMAAVKPEVVVSLEREEISTKF